MWRGLLQKYFKKLNLSCPGLISRISHGTYVIALALMVLKKFTLQCLGYLKICFKTASMKTLTNYAHWLKAAGVFKFNYSRFRRFRNRYAIKQGFLKSPVSISKGFCLKAVGVDNFSQILSEFPAAFRNSFYGYQGLLETFLEPVSVRKQSKI